MLVVVNHLRLFLCNRIIQSKNKKQPAGDWGWGCKFWKLLQYQNQICASCKYLPVKNTPDKYLKLTKEQQINTCTVKVFFHLLKNDMSQLTDLQTGVCFYNFLLWLDSLICLFTGQIVSICPGQCGKVPDREIWRCWDNKGCHCTQRTGKLLFINIMNLCFDLFSSCVTLFKKKKKEISVQHMQTCMGQAFLCPCQSSLTCKTPLYLLTC